MARHMSLNRKQVVVGTLGLVFLASLVVVAWVEGGKLRFQPKPEPIISSENEGCVACHTEKTPVIVQQWADSEHGQLGVGCIGCHQAEKTDVDAYRHEGALIATIVTPNDCARCHAQVAEEFQASHHAKAGDILNSLDNILGEVIEGVPAATNGCIQCHGSKVALLTDANGNVRKDDGGRPMFDPSTWPNSGMGRINLDGSLGSCSACHSRHTFSRAMARQPENCGKCHMGPDHPQIEIYNESKHGIAYAASSDEDMNLDAKKWVVGEDYFAAPTCATCHMSATRNLPVTHDVGDRISWTLRPKISKLLENHEERRSRMKDVCEACHSPGFTRGFYKQYDEAIHLYNDKYGGPSTTIMGMLKERGLISPDPFDDHIEWVYFELWHHEGRRARMGASMMGPDYTQWHGFYEVAKHFYFKFLPMAKELSEGDEVAMALIDSILASEEHAWLDGLSLEDRERLKAYYKERYGDE
ncbi:hypothetical protein H8D30_03330 [bacterium]|nr:hypothetical protein [bacterium]